MREATVCLSAAACPRAAAAATAGGSRAARASENFSPQIYSTHRTELYLVYMTHPSDLSLLSVSLSDLSVYVERVLDRGPRSVDYWLEKLGALRAGSSFEIQMSRALSVLCRSRAMSNVKGVCWEKEKGLLGGFFGKDI